MSEPRTLTEADVEAVWLALSKEERDVLWQEVAGRNSDAARHEAKGGAGKAYRPNVAPTPNTPATHSLFERDLIQRAPVEGLFEWSPLGRRLLSRMRAFP